MLRSALIALAVDSACARNPEQAAKRSHYVANGGDDSGPGTEAAPWRSLARLANVSFSPGDSIYLKSGGVASVDNSVVISAKLRE